MVERVFTNIRYSIAHLQYVISDLQRVQQNTRGIYARIDAHQERLKADEKRISFPTVGKKDMRGMEIELRYVLVDLMSNRS